MLRQAAAHGFRGPAALLLWASWLAGPVAWALHENVSYFLAPQICVAGRMWLLNLTSLLALALAAAGGAIAWRSRQLARAQEDVDEATRERIGFMTIIGLLFSSLSVFGILVESIPSFILDPCLDAQ